MLNNFKFPLSIIKYKFKKFNKEIKTKTYLEKKERILFEKLQKNGYCVIENFYTKKECDELIEIIEKNLSNNDTDIFEDSVKSDQRIFFSEKISDKIYKYFKNELVHKVGEFYTKFQIKPAFTLANKVSYKKNNLGSGGGWHKDAYYPQFKSILYLNDVHTKNGPFQLLIKSNKIVKSILISLRLKKGYPDTRFSEQDLKVLCNEKIKTLTGKAGTLILFDGSLIHRGTPILEGKRYALTNYYFPKSDFQNLIEKFKNKINNV